MSNYTLEAGRCINRDGKPFFIVKRPEGVRHVEADETARQIIKWLQSDGAKILDEAIQDCYLPSGFVRERRRRRERVAKRDSY